MKVKKHRLILLLLVVVAAIGGVVAWLKSGHESGHDLVASMGVFTDGGTFHVTLIDSAGHREELCFDNRIQSPTPGRLYIGAPHPTLPGAKLVPLGSKVEKETIAILQRHLNRQLWPWQQWALAGLSPQAAARRDEKTYHAYWLMKAIKRLKALDEGQQPK